MSYDENKNVLWIADKTQAQLTSQLLEGSVGGVASDTGNYLQRLHSGELKIVKNWTPEEISAASKSSVGANNTVQTSDGSGNFKDSGLKAVNNAGAVTLETASVAIKTNQQASDDTEIPQWKQTKDYTNLRDIQLSSVYVSGFNLTSDANNYTVASGVFLGKTTHDGILTQYTPSQLVFAKSGIVGTVIVFATPSGIIQTTNVALVEQHDHIPLWVISKQVDDGLFSTVDWRLLNQDARHHSVLQRLYTGIVTKANGTGLLAVNPSTKAFTITASMLFNADNDVDVPAYDSTVTPFKYAYNTTVVPTQTILDWTKYNNGGVLTSVANNKFANHWIFREANPTGRIYVMYGTAVYNSVAESDAEQLPATRPTVLGDYTTYEEMYKVVLKGDGTVAQVTDLLAKGKGQSTTLVTSLPATHVTFTPAGGISSTDVQAALEELDAETYPYTDTKEVTGFTEPGSIDVAYNSTNRTITLTGTVKALWRGKVVAVLVSGWVSPAHSATLDRTYYLYYDGASFIWSETVWTFDMLQITTVRYFTNEKYAIRECHGLMDHRTHKELHETMGTYKSSGGLFSGFTLGSTTAANRRPTLSSSTINDEDIPTTIAASSTGNYARLHLTGATGVPNYAVDQTDFLSVGAGGRPNYNQFTGGSWQLTEIANNDYIKYFVIAVPVTSDAVSQKYRVQYLMGQAVSATLANIQAITPTSHNFGELTGGVLNEYVFLGEIIVRATATSWALTSVSVLSGTRASQVSFPSGAFQPLDDTLTALAGITTGADRLPYFNGVETATHTTLTSFSRTLLDDTDAVVARETLQVQERAGINWTSRTSAADNNWIGVCYGNGLFVATAYSGTGNRVMTSQDGITWTTRSTAGFDNSWVSVCYGNGLFVSVSENGTANRVMTSPDGITWTTRSTSGFDNSWSSVCFGNGLFVAVAYSGTGNRVMTSQDGITWTTRSTSGFDNSWLSVCYGNGLFVAVSSSGAGNRVMTSPDGINWTSRTSAADNNWRGVCYGNGLFVAVGSTGTGNRVMTSPDGINWNTRSTTGLDNDWRGVCYGSGLFVAVAQSGTGNRVMTSSNGITWTTRSSAADINWRFVCFGNGMFVSIADSGAGNRVMSSGLHVESINNRTMYNPMTTSGDITYAGVSGAETRLPKGTSGQALVMNSGATAPEWRSILCAASTASATGAVPNGTGLETITGSATVTRTLPAANSGGASVCVRLNLKSLQTGGSLTYNTAGSDKVYLFGGTTPQTSFSMAFGSSVSLVSDGGTNWYVVG